MLTWRMGWMQLERQRSKLRQSEEAFMAWMLAHPPLRVPGTAAIFTASSTGIPLSLTHHRKHNQVLHERVLLMSTAQLRCAARGSRSARQIRTLGQGIFRLILSFGLMESPDVMEALKLASNAPELRGVDPERITYYFRPGDGRPEGRRARDGVVEKGAVRGDAPQCEFAGRLFRCAGLLRWLKSASKLRSDVGVGGGFARSSWGRL